MNILLIVCIVILVAVMAVAGYYGRRWYKKRQARMQPAVGYP